MSNPEIRIPFIPQDFSEADIIAAVREAYGNHELAPQVARVVASMWQSSGTVGHQLASLATGCSVDRVLLLADIHATRQTCGYFDRTMTEDDRMALDLLSTFVINHNEEG